MYKSAKGADERRQGGNALASVFGGALDTAPVLRGFLTSAKGADERRQGGNALASVFGGAPDTAPVLRGCFDRRQFLQMVAAAVAWRGGAKLLLRLSDRKLLHLEGAEAAGGLLMAPASTIKPFTLMALLEAGKLRASDEFACSRHLRIGSHLLDCVHSAVPLPMNPARAIAYSCNGAVAHFAERFEVDELPRALLRDGFASVTGLSPGAEVTGEVQRDTVGGSCKLQALGEEGIVVTPVELLLAYARLAKRASDSRYACVLQGLEGAVEFGTAQEARLTKCKVAGKTGSIAGAAWFAGFAPSRAPEFAVVVLVQGRSGGSDAAPVARQLLSSVL